MRFWRRHSSWWIIFGLLNLVQLASCVIVDGSKKKDISATKNQGREQAKIDAFNTKTCGLSDQNMDEHEFVNMAREGQFPWIASFQIRVPKNSTLNLKEKVAKKSVKETKSLTGHQLEDVHFCCGSFISDRWILSAAHCFAPATIKNYLENDKLKVVAGSQRVSSRSSVNRNLTIQRIFYHGKFDNSMPIGFDIALVELQEPVKFTQKRNKNQFGDQNQPFFNAICLPKTGVKYKFNETARVAGWGLSNEGDASSTPSKLLTTDILLNNPKECAEHYSKQLKSDKPRKQSKDYDDFLCAGYKSSRDACQSDSGGPLMQYADGKAVVIGIVSYGIGCATKGVPGLYTRTSTYINWIRDITKNGKDSSTSFKLLEFKSKSTTKPAEQHSTTWRPTSAPKPSPAEMKMRSKIKAQKAARTTTATPTTTTTTAAPKLATTGLPDDSGVEFKFFDQ